MTAGSWVETAAGERRFATSPVAVLAFIIDDAEQFLLLRNPQRDRNWEVANGALEADETLVDGAMREAREEAGAALLLRPLGIVHASTFRYDESVRTMQSVSVLLAYEGGEVEPGDDMAGSDWEWFGLERQESGAVVIGVPPEQVWQFRRARDLFRLWKDEDVVLQPLL